MLFNYVHKLHNIILHMFIILMLIFGQALTFLHAPGELQQIIRKHTTHKTKNDI